jgi:hypothetical protein
MVAAQNDPQRVHLSPQPPAAPTPGSVRCPQRRPAQQATVAPPFLAGTGPGISHQPPESLPPSAPLATVRKVRRPLTRPGRCPTSQPSIPLFLSWSPPRCPDEVRG